MNNKTEQPIPAKDIIDDFIKQCCIVEAGGEVAAMELYNVFKEWWGENVSKKNIPSQKRFGIFMNREFKSLEDENRRLKRIVADLSLDNHVLKDLLSKNF